MNAPRCDADGRCVTCSDSATPMRILSIADGIAICADDDDARSEVMLALVPTVRAGDRVLVHAGVALSLDQLREARP